MTNKGDEANFFVAGINYRKTDAVTRGKYALTADMVDAVLIKARQAGSTDLLLISTCNRTEIYCYASSPYPLIKLLCEETTGELEEFTQHAYIKRGQKSVEHLFMVAAGLDSQVLGDYEIVGQLKAAYRQSKKAGMAGSELARMLNAALRASREVKNATSICRGTVSLSFAAVKYVKALAGDISTKRILLLGTGKIGTNTCKNLVDYAGAKNITLINRTRSKAELLATRHELRHAPLETLHQEIREAEIIITATSALAPSILKKDLEESGKKLIIDLSLPGNVAQDVKELKHIRLIRVDELSKLKDDTLTQRRTEIPHAKKIISAHLHDFTLWQERRKDAPLLHHLKCTLIHIQKDPVFRVLHNDPSKITEHRIRKLLGETAKKFSEQERNGCHFISAINQFMN